MPDSPSAAPSADPAGALIPPHTASRAAFARKLALTLGLMSAFGPFAIDTYLPAFPTIAADFGTSMAMVQYTLPSFLVGLAIGQVLWGTLSDHIGRRRPLLIGCILFSCTALICALAPSIHLMILARFFMGLGGSAGVVVSRAIVRDLCEEHEAAGFYSLMMIIGGIGPIVAPFLGSLLLAYAHWRGIFWVITLFGAICLATVMRNVPETLAAEYRSRTTLGALARAYGRVLANTRFLGPALAISCTSGMLFTYIASASFLFIELFGVPKEHFGFLFASNSVGLYIAGQSNRWLLRRYAAETLLRKGMWLNAGAALALLLCAASGWGGLPALFACLFVCLSSLGIIFPNATAMIMQPFAAEAGVASALLGVMQFVIGASGGALVSLFQNGTALPMAIQMLAYSLLARGIMLLAPRGRHTPAPVDDVPLPPTEAA